MNSLDAGNPIRCIREELGLTRRELAQVLKLSYERVAAAELGHIRQIPPSWQPALAAVGVDDFAGLTARYHAWRDAKAASLTTTQEARQ